MTIATDDTGEAAEQHATTLTDSNSQQQLSNGSQLSINQQINHATCKIWFLKSALVVPL